MTDRREKAPAEQALVVERQMPAMRLIAHRGFADRYPANTLVAIENAVADADMIELDVRRCGSGELVVFHDEVVDRDTDGSGRVDDLPLAQLEDLDVLETGTGVPALEAAADAIPAHTGINLELKERDIANEAVAAASTVENEVVVSSFDGEALDDLETDDPTVELAYLFGLNADEDFDNALALDCEYIHVHWGHWLLTDAIERAHDADMKVNVWTIDSSIATRALERAGVDGVIADSPDVC
nr:glycerophosphodiester phosphodiesterase family protein [Halococcus sediminicola]